MKQTLLYFALMLLSGSIAGCGNGGGASNSGGNQTTSPAIVLNTVLSSGRADRIGSINVTAELPDGVTVTADAFGFIPQSALYLSGQGAAFAATPNTTAILIGKYYPATPTSRAKVSIAFTGIVNSGGGATGMNPGEFATLLCDVAPGALFDAATLLPLTGIDIADSVGTQPHLSETTPPLAWITYQISK